MATKFTINRVNEKFKLNIQGKSDFKDTYIDGEEDFILEFLDSVDEYSFEDGYFYTDKEFYRFFKIININYWYDLLKAHNFVKPRHVIDKDGNHGIEYPPSDECQIFTIRSKTTKVIWDSLLSHGLFYVLSQHHNDFEGLYNPDFDGIVADDICLMSFKHNSKMSVDQCLKYSIAVAFKASSEKNLKVLPANLYKQVPEEDWSEMEPGFKMVNIPRYFSGMEYFINAQASEDEVYRFIEFYKAIESVVSIYHQESLVDNLKKIFRRKRILPATKEKVDSHVKSFSSVKKSDEEAFRQFLQNSSVKFTDLKRLFSMIETKGSGEKISAYINRVARKIYKTRNSLVHGKENFNSSSNYFDVDELFEVNKTMKTLAELSINSIAVP